LQGALHPLVGIDRRLVVDVVEGERGEIGAALMLAGNRPPLGVIGEAAMMSDLFFLLPNLHLHRVPFSECLGFLKGSDLKLEVGYFRSVLRNTVPKDTM